MAAIKMNLGKNRRSEERYKIDIPANLIDPIGNFVETIDISAHGVGFFSDTRVDKGQSCQLVINIPDPLGPMESVILPLRVQNVTEQNAMIRVASMIELKRMPDDDREKLSYLVNRLSGKRSGLDLMQGEIPIPAVSGLQFWEKDVDLISLPEPNNDLQYWEDK